jgi:hypothetical protein
MFSLSRLAPVIPLGGMIAIAGYVHEVCELTDHKRYHVFLDTFPLQFRLFVEEENRFVAATIIFMIYDHVIYA